MPSLTPDEQTRLISILGMLGSNFAGERASAGLLATRLPKDHGLRWADVIGGPPRHEQPRMADHSSTDLGLCMRHLTSLAEWEQEFCRSLAMRSQLPPKQVDVVQKIAVKLPAWDLE